MFLVCSCGSESDMFRANHPAGRDAMVQHDEFSGDMFIRRDFIRDDQRFWRGAKLARKQQDGESRQNYLHDLSLAVNPTFGKDKGNFVA